MAASYPGAVKTFTTRNAADTIEPSHVNDLQDEVNAIEAGLLNGTARLASSNASVNSLQVSSNSTFAVRPVMPPPEMALVFLASTGAVASSAASTIAWNAQSYVGNSSMHSTASNPERLVPQTTGMYQVVCQVLFSSNAALTARNIAIDDSSGGQIAIGRVSSNIDTPYATAIGFKRFDALGGYVTARVAIGGGSTVSISTGIGNTWFALTKL
jgi:hypothetical protein